MMKLCDTILDSWETRIRIKSDIDIEVDIFSVKN